MILYVDLFIIKNLVFNMLIIFLSGNILQQKTNIKRCFFSALVGTIYAFLAILNKNQFLVSNLMKLLMTFIMILIAYLPSKIYNTFFVYCFFILTSSCIGGVLVMLNLQKTFIVQLLMFVVIEMIIYLCMKKYKEQKIYESYKCRLTINVVDIKLSLEAFIDTGNTLKDSLSGESVIFVSIVELEKSLPEKLIKILKSEVLEIDEEYNDRIKMIEYQTINKSKNIVVGVKADSVIVETEKYTIINEKIIVAPSENKFKNCNALIGMNVLEEGCVYGNTASFEIKNKKVME